jgi:NAD+ kinase
MKNIALICHPNKTYLPELLGNIVNWCEKHEIKAFMLPETAKKFGYPGLALEAENLVKAVDMGIVLGGDGTILSATRWLAPNGIPVAGINLGHLGFLSLDEPDNAIQTLEKLKNKEYAVEPRMMLEAQVYRKGCLVYQGIALNDVVIQKESKSRVIDVDISISGTSVNSYRGDGVIFSTPTGSTAYSLSAGGPIVSPNMELIILCPLNCHTLSARPLIACDKETLTAVLKSDNTRVDIVLDGQESFSLENQDCIKISKNSFPAQIITFNPHNFFQLLRKKMHWK